MAKLLTWRWDARATFKDMRPTITIFLSGEMLARIHLRWAHDGGGVQMAVIGNRMASFDGYRSAVAALRPIVGEALAKIYADVS